MGLLLNDYCSLVVCEVVLLLLCLFVAILANGSALRWLGLCLVLCLNFGCFV